MDGTAREGEHRGLGSRRVDEKAAKGSGSAMLNCREHGSFISSSNDRAQRPPPETPGPLQQSLTNYLNRPTAQRRGGSLQRSC
jgi:hypothetical protein